MSTSVPPDCKKFRAAVAPMFVFILIIGMVGAFLGIVFIYGGSHVELPVFIRAIVPAGAFLLVYSLVMAWVLSMVYPASFSADGIYGHSTWGARRFVRWYDIATVRSFRFLNLRWLRIFSTHNKKVTWLALFQSNKAEFRQEILRLAPASSPVLNHLK